MGSVFKRIKKTFKKVTKPLSKMTKGIARGIAKVGKAVMRGVSKLGNKFGPLGMIALSIALPAAMGGLSGMIGTAGVPQLGYSATGMMGSQNVFLKAIGNVGNVIRTGYSNATGAIGKTFGNITKSISQGFSKFAENTGNIWKNISRGTKNLFKNSRNMFNNFKKTLKLPSNTAGVDVAGWGGPAGGASTGGNYVGMTSRMTTDQVAALMQSEAGMVTHTRTRFYWKSSF